MANPARQRAADSTRGAAGESGWRHIPWASNTYNAHPATGHHYINKAAPQQQVDFHLMPRGDALDPTPRVELRVLVEYGANKWVTAATVSLDIQTPEEAANTAADDVWAAREGSGQPADAHDAFNVALIRAYNAAKGAGATDDQAYELALDAARDPEDTL